MKRTFRKILIGTLGRNQFKTVDFFEPLTTVKSTIFNFFSTAFLFGGFHEYLSFILKHVIGNLYLLVYFQQLTIRRQLVEDFSFSHFFQTVTKPRDGLAGFELFHVFIRTQAKSLC